MRCLGEGVKGRKGVTYENRYMGVYNNGDVYLCVMGERKT